MRPSGLNVPLSKIPIRPGAMHSAFNQFAAFTQDAAANKALAANGKLAMPVLAVGGDHSFGTQMADTWSRPMWMAALSPSRVTGLWRNNRIEKSGVMALQA